jgi:hypothetical protein
MQPRRSRTNLRPCYAGCTHQGKPVLVLAPQKFCSAACWRVFVQETGSRHRDVYRQLDCTPRDTLADWRTLAPKTARRVRKGHVACGFPAPDGQNESHPRLEQAG